MKVCILGNGLTSLTLAKALVNQGIYVDLYLNKKNTNFDKTRTIGISKSNIEFFNNNILNIDKYLWDINKIEILSEKLKNKKILNFENKNLTLFSIFQNFKLYNLLFLKLKKSGYIKFKKDFDSYDVLKKKYSLIINCDFNNQITKKFFNKKFTKNYKSYAHTTIINHQKLKNNKTACQIFTKKGPLAFLPISENKTSVVFSAKGSKKIDIISFIKKNNTKYEIKQFSNPISFELKLFNLRSYYHKNILAFGDLLHKIHPLAGQGFNMSIRDISELLKLIKFKKEHGLDVDKSVCIDFEKKMRHRNFIFSSGVDFIYEFFNFDSKIKNNILNNSIQLIDKNKNINQLINKIADRGIIF